ncbi:hypothetical protein ABIC83_002656 [Roseateles asaccharophilus]|uniref:hypothetical protein n=1 Tax=Roseateles asaccharophilus TaxID=582607 RepID=UPI003832DF3B
MLGGLIDLGAGGAAFHEDLIGLLVKAGGSRRSAEMFVQLRGLAGDEPQSLRAISRELSAERVRQLVRELEIGPLQQALRDESGELAMLRAGLVAALRRIEKHAPGADADIQAALAAELNPLQTAPASVVRISDILGVEHDLRLTKWTARAKFVDADRLKLATPLDRSIKDTVTGIVPNGLPDDFANFINFARRYSRGSGVVGASQVAQLFTSGGHSATAMAPNEAAAYLRPFSVHLGWHDGDDWFCFFNSANEFFRKVANRVEMFKRGSFQSILEFHQRFSRSWYAGEKMIVPESVLRVALELAGFVIEGDEIQPMTSLKIVAGRRTSETQMKMVGVFHDLLASRGGQKSVKRNELVQALLKAGIRESTARVYLGNKGLFICTGNLCRLADSADEVPGIDPTARRKPGRPPKMQAGEADSSAVQT